MKFAIVDPATRRFEIVDTKTLLDAEQAIGLDPLRIDHGLVMRGIGIFVSEFGLYEPVDRQHYFAIGTHLYAGPAVLFAYDEAGETVDFETLPQPVRFFESSGGVEAATAMGLIERPALRLNGELMWEWPQSKPATVFGTHP